MSDLFQIGRSALLAFQQQLATTGHNVANVGTQGYSRQRVNLSALQGAVSGSGVQGAGVSATGIQRMTDQLLTRRLLGDAAGLGRQSLYSDMATRVDSLLSVGETGIGDALTQFFDAANAVAADPRSIAARTVLLSRAEGLAQGLDRLGAELNASAQDLDAQLQQSVNTVNQLSARVAELNHQIALTRGDAGGHPPNELLDQRDRLLEEMASHIGIRTVTQDDGSINAFSENGEALVIGHESNPLTVIRSPYGTGRLELGLQTGNSVIPIAGVSGGRIGGILDSQRELIDVARAQLGRLTIALSTEFNRIHGSGVTLDGNAGGDFFSLTPPLVRGHQDNAGTAVFTANFADPSAIVAGDLLLEFDGSNWSARDAGSGQALPLSGDGSAANPFSVGGISLSLAGTALPGDRFVVQPAAGAIRGLSVAVSDPRGIAAASPLVAHVDPASSAGFGVADLQVDAGTPSSAQRIVFLSASTYQVDGGPVQTVSGNEISGPGWTMTLSGTPAAGDAIDLAAPGANSSDNGNASALASLQNSLSLDNLTPSGFHSALISRMGAGAQQAQLATEAHATIQRQNLASRDAISGVNLDEEAAQMLKFQQAYQAASQIIKVADDLFQTLFSVVRR